MEWVKTMILSICVMTIITQLVPNEKYAKYVRFYSGLMILFIAAGPVLNLFSGENAFADVLRTEFLKEEYSNLEQKAESLAEMKTEQIQTSFEKESSRQIIRLASAYGFEDAKVHISYGDNYSIDEIELWLCEDRPYFELRKEVGDLFAAKKVTVYQTGCPEGGYEEVGR